MRENFNTNAIIKYIKENKLSKVAFCRKCNISLYKLNKLLNNNFNIRISAFINIYNNTNIKISDLFIKQ